MNILYYGSWKVRGLNANQVHIHEVLSNLLHLGHYVVPVFNIPGEASEGSAKQKSPKWAQLKGRLCSTVLYELFKGEIRILWSFFSEIRLFSVAFARLLKHRGKIDVIYKRHSLFNSEYLLARLFRIASVNEVNGIIADEAYIAKSGDKISLRIITQLEKCNLPKADKIIVVAPRMKQLLYDKFHIAEDKIIVIPNGVNTNLFKPIEANVKETLGLDTSYYYIGFLGSFCPWHGLEDIVRTAPFILEQAPETKFILVGDGILKDDIVKMVGEFNLKNHFIFTGKVPYETVPVYINAFDVCVAPMKKNILGSPLKLCEYMACAKPTVASDNGAFDILAEVNSGLLANPEQPQEFAEATLKLLKKPELRQLMGENGRKYVVKNRSWESVAKRVYEVCEQATRKMALRP